MRSLDSSKLASFQPKSRAERTETAEKGWPSREPSQDVESSFSIRASVDVIERFKALCKAERYKYADMLEILLDEHDQRSR